MLNRQYAQIGIVTAAIIAFTFTPAIAATIRPVQGPVILSRGGPAAKYIWDASSYIASLASDKLLGSAGMRAIEASAIVALADKADASPATSVTLAVTYRPPSASSAYGAPSTTGIIQICILTASRAAVAANGDAWSQDLANGRIPSGITLRVTGKLPPAQ